MRLCGCGCGQKLKPYRDKKTGHISGYPENVAGHGLPKRYKAISEKTRGEKHYASKPIGTRVLSAGYIKIKCPDGKWRYEHRVVTKAKENEVVHHKNKIKHDNTISNLEIMTSSNHMRMHQTLVNRWSIHYARCSVCRTTKYKHHGYGICRCCTQKIASEKKRELARLKLEQMCAERGVNISAQLNSRPKRTKNNPPIPPTDPNSDRGS